MLLRLFLCTLTLVCLVDTSLAQEPSGPPVEPFQGLTVPLVSPTVGTFWGSVPPRVGVQHITGPGVGYLQSFTTLDGFVPFFGVWENTLPFFELRGLLSNTSLLGSNVGIGNRIYSPSRDRIFGVYTSWDQRDSGFGTFNQISAGVESLGRFFDFRTNAYVPIGQDRKQYFDGFLNDPGFAGTQILLTRNQAFEAAMRGLDMDFGAPLPILDRYGLRGYAGWYYLQGDGGVPDFGVRGQVTSRLSDAVSMGLGVQNDRIFDTTVVFNAAIRFGGMRGRSIPGENAVFSRIADPVVRNYAIPVDNQVKTTREPATDPRTGLPIQVIHVKNDAAPGGDGSFERPLNQLALAPGLAGPFGIILVQRGDGTSTNMNQGVVLQNSQRLLGDSLRYVFLNREVGSSILPNLLTGVPNIGNPAGNAVTLASGNEVAGFLIGPSVDGIRGNAIQDFFIHDNTINSPSNVGILLTEVVGSGTITGNNVTNSASSGIDVSTSGILNASFASNAVSNSAGHGIILTSLNNAQVTGTFTGNTVLTNGVGNLGAGIGAVSNDNSVMNVIISNNTSIGNDVGIAVNNNLNSQMLTHILNNTTNSNQLSGISVAGNGAMITALVRNNVLTNDNVSGLGGDGFSAVNFNLGILNLALTNNISVPAIGGGYLLSNQGGGGVGTFNVEDTRATNVGIFNENFIITTVPAGTFGP